MPARQPLISLQAHRLIERVHRCVTKHAGDLFSGAKSSRKRGIDEDRARFPDPPPSNSATRNVDTDPLWYLKRRSFRFVEPSLLGSTPRRVRPVTYTGFTGEKKGQTMGVTCYCHRSLHRTAGSEPKRPESSARERQRAVAHVLRRA